MTTRIILAGVLGGIAMFIWSGIAHMALPLGEAGITQIPNESAVLDCLKANIEKRGLFIFPGVSEYATRQERREAMKQIAEKAATGPSGIMMYYPKRPFTFGRWLTVEFATELVESLLVVALLAQTRLMTFIGRVTFVTVAGILAAIATNVSYWNWYGFPKRYIAAYMFTQIVGFFLAGIVAAFVLGKRTEQTLT